ncbi:MAG: hypothetical protein ACI39R_03410 [Lachnospiraceae bacterium]
MTQLLEIRAKMIEIYQKTERYVKFIINAIIYFCAFEAIKNTIGYNAKLSGFFIILALSVVSAFLPGSVVVAVMVVYVALQLYSASFLMAATVLIIAVILFCFFLRFTPEYGQAVIGMPVLMGIKMPYVLPICLGLFSTPLSIIPVCVGVFSYYFLKGVGNNLITTGQAKGAEDPFQLYVSALNSVMKNEAMFATMIILALVIVAVYLVRNIKMDYSFEIAIAVGSGTSMIGFIIMMLKYDIGVGIFSVVFFSILSGGIAFLANFLCRPLFYAGTEQVQFEDDYYYYYVKAVPKIKVAGTKVNVKHVVSRRTDSFDEDFGDELDDVDSNLAKNSRNTLSGTTGRVLTGDPDADYEKEPVKKYLDRMSGRNTGAGARSSVTGNRKQNGMQKTSAAGRSVTGNTAQRTAAGGNVAENTAQRTAAGGTAAGNTAQRSVAGRSVTGNTAQRTLAGRTAAGNVTHRTQAAGRTSGIPSGSYEDSEDDF